MAATPSVEFMIELAREAGAMIKKQFYSREKKVEYKISSADLLTETDTAVEQMLISKIKAKFPGHLFFCEESSSESQILTDDPTWIIDPVDGTMNFVHTLPFVATSIGFSIDKRVIKGVVYNPIMDELFFASRGGGAWMMSGSSPPVKVMVAESRPLSESVIATGFASAKIRKLADPEVSKTLPVEHKKHLQELKEVVVHNTSELVSSCRDLRRLGSCAVELCFVAAGRLDGMLEFCPKEWDVAAGAVIVEEAGGYVMNLDRTHPIDISKRMFTAGSSADVCSSLASTVKLPSFNMREVE